MYINETVTSPYVAAGSDVNDINSKFASAMSSQTSIPLVDIGALVFYSGNIILDLIINFFGCIPSILSILLNAFLYIFNVNAFIAAQIKIFFYALFTVLYTAYLLAFILNIRSGVALK